MQKIIYFTFALFTTFSTNVLSSASDLGPSEDSGPSEPEKDSLGLSRSLVCFSGQGYSQEQLITIERVLSSSTEREIPMDNSPEGRDYGYDFSKHSPFHLMLTLAVRASSPPPICYDFGGGYGGDSLHMVLAGGKVTYIEHHPDVAATAHKEVYGALRAISSSTDQKKEFWGRLRMVRSDFLDTKNESLYPKGLQINICNLSNVLHFLTPKQLDTFLPALLEKMAPNGVAFASMHVPCDSPKVVDYFLDQKEKGNPYPGYFRYIRQCEPKGESGNSLFLNFTEIKELSDAEPALEGDLPGKKISRTFFPPAPDLPKFITLKTVIHYFDPDVARTAFESAGFIVQQSLFTDHFGETLEAQKATRETFLTGNYHMMLIATKKA